MIFAIGSCKIGVGVCPTACWPHQSYDGFPVLKLVLGRIDVDLEKSVRFDYIVAIELID